METNDSVPASSEVTPRRVRRVIVPERKPTVMQLERQIVQFPEGVNPYKNIKSAERSYRPQPLRQNQDHTTLTATQKRQSLYDTDSQETDISSTKTTHKKSLRAFLSRLVSCIH